MVIFVGGARAPTTLLSSEQRFDVQNKALGQKVTSLHS